MVQISFLAMIVVLVALVVAGVYLLAMGWRGRRVGTEPRCGTCGYILLYLTSLRCPECGTEVSAAGPVIPVIGERKRRWGVAGLGAVLLVLGCLPVLSPVRDALEAVPWYRYKPAGFVMDDLDAPGTYLKAITELQRRELAGSLPGSVRGKLIDKALREQAATTQGPRWELLEYLGMACVDGGMTEQQRTKFMDQACAVRIVIRPIIAEGDTVPFCVWQEGRGPQGKSPMVFWKRYEDGEQRIDGKVVRSARNGGQGAHALSDWIGLGESVPAGAVGMHTVEDDMDWTVWYGAMGEEAKSQRLGTRKITAKATYAVVLRDQAPKIELLNSETLRKQVPLAIKIKSISQRQGGQVYVGMQFTSAPCDLAFDMFAQTDQGEMKIGWICCAKGDSTSAGAGGTPTKRLPSRVQVSFRPSVDAARNTLNETAIFAGEIVFPDVPVTQETH